MADAEQPKTGFVNNGSLVQYGNKNISDQWDYITISKPEKAFRLIVDGEMPSETNNKPDISVSFFEGSIPLFSAIGTWKYQGQSSLASNKKNYSFKLKNPSTGNKLKVKIGEWPSMSSIVCKGYGTDRILIRDSMNTEIWRWIRKSNNGFIVSKNAYQYFDSKDFGVHTSALFSTAGTPCEIWHNNDFLGLYVIRASNDPACYLMDDDNQQHIMIQPQHAKGLWRNPFNPVNWEFSSPSIKDYDTGQDISASHPDINNSAARVFNWMVDCVKNPGLFRKTYKEYINLESLLDFIIITELSLSFDSLDNNFMMGSWDATPTSGIWSFYPYDEDETFGISWFLDPPITADIGWVFDNNSFSDQEPGIFKVCREEMRPELRIRWKFLRDNNVLSASRINKYIIDYISMIEPEMMENDIRLWSTTAGTGVTNGINVRATSVSFLSDIAEQRIQWLDQQFKYYG